VVNILLSHEREKLINAIIFFARNTRYLGKTKLCKLLSHGCLSPGRSPLWPVLGPGGYKHPNRLPQLEIAGHQFGVVALPLLPGAGAVSTSRSQTREGTPEPSGRGHDAPCVAPSAANAW
jgi:hypothetical protein